METAQPSNEIELSAQTIQGFLDRYQQLRATGIRVNNTLVGRLSRETIFEGARRLDMLCDDVLTFRNESESFVLMDYCIFNVDENGKNTVERYLDETPAVQDSVEREYLNAMRSATYALLVVERIIQGVGCYVRNQATDACRLLLDKGLSMSVSVGMAIATRLLDYGDFVTTGGAALPIGRMTSMEEREELKIVQAEFLARDFDPASIIQTILHLGASSRIRYDEAASGAPQTPRLESHRRRELVTVQEKRIAQKLAVMSTSNRRCRCGSGKMFKNCCGK